MEASTQSRIGQARTLMLCNAKDGHLPSSVASIDSQIRAGHEAAGIADEEDASAAVLLGRAEAAEHVLGGPVGAALGELLEQLLDHGRDDVARRDGVDADAVRAPLGGQVAGELDDGGLAGVVGRADEALYGLSLASLLLLF